MLRCSRCGKPICPQCGVRTPVGMRCPECAGVRGLPTYATGRAELGRAAGAGVVVGALIGILWGFFPAWGFYMALALGFGVAEAMAAAAREKRGADLMTAGWIAVTLGLVISRAVMAQRLGVTWDEVQAFSGFIERGLRLRVIPDGLFAAIAYLVVYLRFR
jgi:hypothetical protein